MQRRESLEHWSPLTVWLERRSGAIFIRRSMYVVSDREGVFQIYLHSQTIWGGAGRGGDGGPATIRVMESEDRQQGHCFSREDEEESCWSCSGEANGLKHIQILPFLLTLH